MQVALQVATERSKVKNFDGVKPAELPCNHLLMSFVQRAAAE